MRHEIQITHEDIQEGQCGNRYLCALARAVGRHFDSALVDVDLFDVHVWETLGPPPEDEEAEWPVRRRTLAHTDGSSKFVFEFDRQVGRVDPQVVVLLEGEDAEEGSTGAGEGVAR